MRVAVVCLTSLLFSCGYRPLVWDTPGYRTLEIAPVRTQSSARNLRTRMRDALAERTLSVSSLKPVDKDGDLRLECELLNYEEHVIATGADARTRQIQFTITASFELYDKQKELIWSLKNYRYSDQFQLSTTSEQYRNESVYEQDNSMKAIADLVITNLVLALVERGQHE